ncbi:hypothetical protein CEUSTIGMA_g4689.t1, partial [Chlamydomonas eustigma]
SPSVLTTVEEVTSSPSVPITVEEVTPSPSVLTTVEEVTHSPSVPATVEEVTPSPSVLTTVEEVTSSPSVPITVEEVTPLPSVPTTVEEVTHSPSVLATVKVSLIAPVELPLSVLPSEEKQQAQSTTPTSHRPTVDASIVLQSGSDPVRKSEVMDSQSSAPDMHTRFVNLDAASLLPPVNPWWKFQHQVATQVSMTMVHLPDMMASREVLNHQGWTLITDLPTLEPPEEVDYHYQPYPEDVVEYARYLGMDPVADQDLLYIARWALEAPVPHQYTVHVDTEGYEYFYDTVTSITSYAHPKDEYYMQLYRQKKARTKHDE